MNFKLIEKLLKRKQSDNFDNSYLIHLSLKKGCSKNGFIDWNA